MLVPKWAKKYLIPATAPQGIRRLWLLRNYLAGPVRRAEKREGRTKFDMSSWSGTNTFLGSPTQPDAEKIVGTVPHLCNTTACALGWATRVFPGDLRLSKFGGIRWYSEDLDNVSQSHNEHEAAARFFGISFIDASRLFGSNGNLKSVVGWMDEVIAKHVTVSEYREVEVD